MADNPQSMECPYCKKFFHVNFHRSFKVDPRTSEEYVYEGQNGESRWRTTLHYQDCPSCQRLVIVYDHQEDSLVIDNGLNQYETYTFRREILYPKVSCNRVVAPDVPQTYADDFVEACNVLPLSPRASAMLSRRLLQAILHKQYNIKAKDLYTEIETFVNNEHPPTSLSDYLHPLRVVGNFGAHPIDNQSTGDDIKVEPEEAEWLLDLLEELFDFAYVKPARFAARKQQVNQNLQNAGRKPLP